MGRIYTPLVTEALGAGTPEFRHLMKLILVAISIDGLNLIRIYISIIPSGISFYSH